MRSEILWAARHGSLFATHQSTKQLNFVADGCMWMSDFALAKVSVFSNLPIVFSEMVLCFIFPTSRDLHANTFRELTEVYTDLICHAGFHFLTTGNFTLWYFPAKCTCIISIWLQFIIKCTYFDPTAAATISILLHLFRANVTRIETIWFFMHMLQHSKIWE